MLTVSNGYGRLVLWPGARINDVNAACQEGIDAHFDDDGVCDYMREQIPEIRRQQCSNKFLITAFVSRVKEAQWNGSST